MRDLENLGFPTEKSTIEINPKNYQKSPYVKDKKSVQGQSKFHYLNSGQTLRRYLKKTKDIKHKEIMYTVNFQEANHAWANTNLCKVG